MNNPDVLPLSGWVVIDKPVGMSSARVVAILKKVTKVSKLGHAGTLDPLASGVLPIAIGEATKLIRYAMDGIKTYQFTISFGQARDTDDAEGEVIATHSYLPGADEIIAILPTFTGDIMQIPPAYSALKLDGKRAYALARAGQEVKMQARKVHIRSLSLISYTGNTASFEVTCGKGTYIRSLAREMAQSLGTCGYVSMLRRTQVGKFSVNQAILLDKLEKMVHNADRYDFVLPVNTVLDGIPVLVVSEDNAKRLKYGQVIPLQWADGAVAQGVVPVMADGKLVALGEVGDENIKPVRVFNL